MKKQLILNFISWLLLISLLFLFIFLLPTKSEAKSKPELINMGEFKITAYCPCEGCSNGWGRRTYSGKTAEAGRTIVVDRSVIDIGSKVKIGKHIYIAEDTGGKVDGDHIDIFFDTHEEVEEFANRKGIKYINVWVVR